MIPGVMIGHAMDYPKLRRGLREHRRESGADGTRRATILLYRRRGRNTAGSTTAGSFAVVDWSVNVRTSWDAGAGEDGEASTSCDGMCAARLCDGLPSRAAACFETWMCAGAPGGRYWCVDVNAGAVVESGSEDGFFTRDGDNGGDMGTETWPTSLAAICRSDSTAHLESFELSSVA
mmetsp:Transcript_8377/g.18939  ORF Transcript_8377/g.18939 Transcript_8377/m.18939 type:complete len:177 (+) Transcript_8377:81-611(+)